MKDEINYEELEKEEYEAKCREEYQTWKDETDTD